MAEPDITYSRIPEDVARRWRTVSDVCGDDQNLRNERYLPYLNKADTSAENTDRNRAYRDRAVLFAATSFTRDGLVGMAFRKNPTTEFPPKLDYLTTDADGANVSIFQQSQAALAAVLDAGRYGLCVTYSSDLARPTIKAYKAPDIINWRTQQVGGRTSLNLIVLHEDAEVEDGYGTTCVDQWRELFLDERGCVVRVWRLDEDGKPVVMPMVDQQTGLEADEVILRSVGKPLDFIPFVFIGSQNNDSAIDAVPLYMLAKLNVAHFRNSADYEDSVFYNGQAQAWASGLDVEWRDHLEKQGMYIGARTPILLPEKGAFGFAQPLPNTLVKEAMDQKEAQMVALGARVIEDAQVVQTATQSNNSRAASTSILATCAENVSEAYSMAALICCRYLDITIDRTQIVYQINQDYESIAGDAQMITALVSTWQAGIIAKNDVRHIMRRHGSIQTERTDEQITADLAAETPQQMTTANPGR